MTEIIWFQFHPCCILRGTKPSTWITYFLCIFSIRKHLSWHLSGLKLNMLPVRDEEVSAADGELDGGCIGKWDSTICSAIGGQEAGWLHPTFSDRLHQPALYSSKKEAFQSRQILLPLRTRHTLHVALPPAYVLNAVILCSEWEQRYCVI